MADREKVIKELESLRDICNAKSNMAIGKGKVAWAGYANMADDALTSLKGQEAVKPYEDYDGHYVWRCGNCRAPIFHSYNEESVEDAKTYAKFCRQCGRPVKWDGRQGEVGRR